MGTVDTRVKPILTTIPLSQTEAFRAIGAGAKPLWSTDTIEVPTTNATFWAADYGDYNLPLTGGGAQVINVKVDEVDPEGLFDRIEVRYNSLNNTWSKVGIAKNKGLDADLSQISTTESSVFPTPLTNFREGTYGSHMEFVFLSGYTCSDFVSVDPGDIVEYSNTSGAITLKVFTSGAVNIINTDRWETNGNITMPEGARWFAIVEHSYPHTTSVIARKKVAYEIKENVLPSNANINNISKKNTKSLAGRLRNGSYNAEMDFLPVAGYTASSIVSVKSGDVIEYSNATAENIIKVFDGSSANIVNLYNTLDSGEFVIPAGGAYFALVLYGADKEGLTIEIKDNYSILPQALPTIVKSYPTINIEEYGARRENSHVQNTAIFSRIIRYILNAGGGKIVIPAGVWEGDIIIPPTTESLEWITVEIEGSLTPAMIFGTIGNFPMQRNCSVLKGQIRAESGGNFYNQFIGVSVEIDKLQVEGVNNPVKNGIDLLHAAQCRITRTNVNTGLYNVQASEPTGDYAGIVTPFDSNAARTYLHDVSVSGYKKGIVINEHMEAGALYISSCKEALNFVFAHHTSYISRACIQRCTRPITVSGVHRFSISQLNLERVGPGQSDSSNSWQTTDFDIYDPSNLGIGDVTWSAVLGGVGAVTSFMKHGGSGIKTKLIGS